MNQPTGGPGRSERQARMAGVAVDDSPLQEFWEKDLETIRGKLIEGLDMFSSNPLVSSSTRYCLALIRTVLFAAATASLIYLQVWWCEEYTYQETATHTAAVLGSNGSVVVESDDDCPIVNVVQDPWAFQLAKKGVLDVAILPTGDFAESLPEIHWYASEEVYRNMDGYLSLLSLGARHRQPVVLSLEITTALTEEVYMAALLKAFSRHKVNLLDEESTRGTVFVWENQVWADGKWTDFPMSEDWLFIVGLASGLMILLAYTVLKWIAQEVRHDWRFSCDVWVAQNDFLWQEAKRLKAFRTESETLSEDEMTAALAEAGSAAKDKEAGQHRGKGKHKELPVRLKGVDKLQMCSPFFILDNFLANAYRCEEEAGLAILSSLFHAIVFCCICVMPCYAVCLKPEWATVFQSLVIAYGLCIIPLGAIYYLSFNHGMLRLSLSLLQIGCLVFWVVLNVLYVVSCLIYLTAISAVDPEMIPEALIPLATIAAYASVVVTRLKDIQQHYTDAMAGKASKGFITSQVARLGLSTGDIIMLTLEGVGALVVLLLLQQSLRKLYAGGQTSNLLQAAIMPCYAVVNSVIQLRREKADEAEDGLKEEWGTYIKDIF